MEHVAEKTQAPNLAVRPPIVVIMGHIDHGKTTLLDAIRKTAVAEKEAGGITQAIGAYQIEHHGKAITFIDTPGHEAFSAMRARGTHVADIAVLVVAADEGVKPQTEEAISIIRQAALPFVVAINKMDVPDADAVRVKQQLAERAVMVEGFGGTVPATELSAKTGQGIEALLETILLLAELEELSDDPVKPGRGVVIESHLDPRRGPTATLLIEAGQVKRGEFIVIGGEAAPLRIFENFRGESIDAAGAAEPIRIAGFTRVPSLGETFLTFARKSEAEAAAAAPRTPAASAAAPSAAAEQGRHVVNIILKADTLGSLEAIASAIAAITSAELSNRMLKSEVGNVTESDVKFAAAARNAFIAGFRVKVPAAIAELADRNRVAIVRSEVIYDLLEAVKRAMLALAPAETRRVELGSAKVLALFRQDRGRQIVGGRVESGLMRPDARFDISRNGVRIGGGRILELQSQRRPVGEVPAGQEFGILAEADTSIAVGDALAAFAEEKVTPKL